MTLDDLDRLAAEKVMGWQIVKAHTQHDDGFYYMGGKPSVIEVYDKPKIKVENWQPTRNIAQAWECLEKMEGSYNVTWNHLHNEWFCSLWDKSHTATASTAPEAIVRAVLKAKGVSGE